MADFHVLVVNFLPTGIHRRVYSTPWKSGSNFVFLHFFFGQNYLHFLKKQNTLLIGEDPNSLFAKFMYRHLCTFNHSIYVSHSINVINLVLSGNMVANWSSVTWQLDVVGTTHLDAKHLQNDWMILLSLFNVKVWTTILILDGPEKLLLPSRE